MVRAQGRRSRLFARREHRAGEGLGVARGRRRSLTDRSRDKAAIDADVVGVGDGSLPGLTDRINSVAHDRVMPPMNVVLHSLPGPTGSRRTVLLVEVPSSPARPHMVEGSYWGRSAVGKRTLTDDEVARLMSERAAREDRFASELTTMADSVDWLPLDQRSRGRLYVIAQPVSTPAVRITDAVTGKHMLDLLLPVVQQFQPNWASSFRYIAHPINHPDGLAAANWGPEQWTAQHEGDLAFLQIRDDGTILFASGDSIRPYGEDGPLAISLPAVCEAIHQVALFAANLATKYLAYSGQWHLGVHLVRKWMVIGRAAAPGGGGKACDSGVGQAVGLVRRRVRG